MSTVVSLKQQQTLPLFPKTNEQHEFAFWLIKARSGFRACKLSMYVDRPVAGMPVFEHDRSFQNDEIFEPVYDHEVEFIGCEKTGKALQQHSERACLAFNMII